jgi:hypothetical protein
MAITNTPFFVARRALKDGLRQMGFMGFTDCAGG